MNEQKLNYIKNNIKFHFNDLSLERQLEIKSRPEPDEWKYLALGEDTLENIEKYGVKGWDNPQFRKRIDLKLAALNREDNKQFAKAYADEYRKKGIWVDPEVARKRYNRCKKYWPYFGGESFKPEGSSHNYTFTFVTPGVTEHGKEEFIRLMSTTTSFEELTQDEWFVLWTVVFTEQTTIQEPQRLRMGQASMVFE